MQRTIILYGDSLLLDSLEASLRRDGEYALLRLSAVHLPTQLSDIAPGTIIYDYQQVEISELYQLLANYPGWQLMGMISSEDFWIMRSEKRKAPSLNEMVDFIRGD